jgi:DNA-binding transcriptional ArsR family regulator
MPEPNVVHDPQVLRAIAHPMRNRILAELSAQGSMRAADIARDLDIPANQASFHLRSLAKHGLVEEDPGAARDKRDRAWRTVHQRGLSINLSELEASPGGRAASAVFRRNAAAWGHLVVERIYSAERDPVERKTLLEVALRLTDEEVTEVAADLTAVVDRWSDRTQGRDESRRTYLYFGAVVPYPAADSQDKG